MLSHDSFSSCGLRTLLGAQFQLPVNVVRAPLSKKSNPVLHVRLNQQWQIQMCVPVKLYSLTPMVPGDEKVYVWDFDNGQLFDPHSPVPPLCMQGL